MPPDESIIPRSYVPLLRADATEDLTDFAPGGTVEGGGDDMDQDLPDNIKATVTGEVARESQLGEDAASVAGGAAGKVVRHRKPGKIVCSACGLDQGTCSHPASYAHEIPVPDNDEDEEGSE